MTIACTRCGASQDGDIIVAPLAFAFKHNSGCGHGVGPLAVIPSAKKVEKPVEAKKDIPKKEVIVNKEVKKTQPMSNKTKVFGQNN